MTKLERFNRVFWFENKFMQIKLMPREFLNIQICWRKKKYKKTGLKADSLSSQTGMEVDKHYKKTP